MPSIRDIESIQARIDASSYLSRIQAKYELDIVTERSAILAHLEKTCTQVAEKDCTRNIEEGFLLDCKNRFVFYWAMMELSADFSQSESGFWQSKFADITIQFALRYAWVKLAKKQTGLQRLVQSCKGNVPGIFILGMGKLGGKDLNFSSDVDLVAFFSTGILPIPDMVGKSYICHQVLQILSRDLAGPSEQDFIWRVDWRLRPNASATTLAMQTEAAMDYYFYHASPWHRLALMKARVVAGDNEIGKEFLQELTPFIWRQNLDYRALDELAEIKQKINLEHPTLKAERQWRYPIDDEVSGFNIKLGTGGIREIEFIVNALQLIWGGKRNSLKTSNTMQALDCLRELNILQQEQVSQLRQAYIFLRSLENSVQMLANQHTHLIPTEMHLQQQLFILIDSKSWDEYVTILNTHRQHVNHQFEQLFHDTNDGLPESSQAIQWPNGLSAAAKEVVAQWENGFKLYGVSSERYTRLKPLVKNLSKYLYEQQDREEKNRNKQGFSNEELSSTVLRLHHFFQSLPQGEQYFRLLAESDKLLVSIIPPLLHSPPMSILLKQSPHIVDCFMQSDWVYERDGFDAEMVLHAQGYETKLERIRRLVNEYLYQLYLQFLQQKINVAVLQMALTDLAEFVIQLCLEVVTKEMRLQDSPIAVLAMGKLATKKMSPTSDLDLIFIYDAQQTDLELAGRFVNRLQTAISTPMREGIVYELDTRLRPSGKSGAPTLSVQSFQQHQFTRAHTWEHIALVPSRVVAGNESLKNAIYQVKRSVLEKKRNQSQFKKDALKMWQRIAEHRIKKSDYTLMSNKLIPGGLMQAEYLAACMILSEPRKEMVDFGALLKITQQSELNRESDLCFDFNEVIEFWSGLQIWERLLAKAEQPIQTICEPYLQAILDYSQCTNIAYLSHKKSVYSGKVIAKMDAFFSNIALSETELEQWQESNVIWE